MSEKFILVLNCGSSSLKFSVINPKNGFKLLVGLAENFFLSTSSIEWKINDLKKEKKLKKNASHQEAFDFINKFILTKNFCPNIIGIGHRIVHGGQNLTNSVIINENIIKQIKNASIFAPLHNPFHLIGIKESIKKFPELSKKNVAVFDTSFHQSIPEKSYLYALPYKLYKKYGIRRYGAHGISHYYVAKKAAHMLKKPFNKLNLITCHLGNGSSIAVLVNGICIDTSMGFTPLEGLVMGTRSGDIDPSIIFFLHEILNISIKKIKNILTKKSGLLGLTNFTSDYRYIESNYFINKNAKRAMEIFCHRLVKYIGGYSMLVNGRLDALVFTGGIGENAIKLRELVLSYLAILNFSIDCKKNFDIQFKKIGFINKKNTTPALVIPTNEELIIAQETKKLII